MTEPEQQYSHRATYCPEDNKIRFYPDWSDPDFDKEQMKSAGYRWASKQECYVCPRWSIRAEDAALEHVEDIEDEDYSPVERAADRAERFSGYRDKRAGEAGDSADRYDSGPDVFGHQNAARADRQARKHDRHRRFAVSQWSKAEYWQERTQGVIANALYRSLPGVRRGRILEIEKEIRVVEAQYTPCDDRVVMAEDRDGNQVPHAYCGKGRARHWVPVHRLEAIKRSYARYIQHLNMRLVYENAMLANEGGRMDEAEMVPGGFIKSNRYGLCQIESVIRSPATKKITSVKVGYGGRVRTVNIQRSGADDYVSPTEEQLAEFHARKEQEKAAAKAAAKKAPKPPALINPTPDDAEKLQAIWNEQAAASNRQRYEGPSTVWYMTQSQYSDRSKGSYGCCCTSDVDEQTRIREARCTGMTGRLTVFKIRTGHRGGFYSSRRVVCITDKPQKPLPWPLLEDAKAQQPTRESLEPRIEEIYELSRRSWLSGLTPEQESLFADAIYCGLAYSSSSSQFGLTDAGHAVLAKITAST